jgi:glycosyltransferase involved in cell wall biosynthesis
LQPSLSLIIPVYNEERTLANRVHRVLELLPELSSRFEVLVIDNGSLDHTCNVADELAREYPQIRVIRHGERRGMEAISETGLSKSQGEIIMLMKPGEAVQPAEIKRLWQISRQETTQPHPRASTLLGRLTQWGQVATQAAPVSVGSVQLLHRKREHSSATHLSSPRRPASFLEHLRGLSIAE